MSFLQGAAQAANDPNNQAKLLIHLTSNPLIGNQAQAGMGLGMALSKLIKPASPMTGAVKPNAIAGDRDIRSGEAAPNAQQWMDVFTGGGR